MRAAGEDSSPYLVIKSTRIKTTYHIAFQDFVHRQGVVKLVAKRIGTVSGRLFVGTTEKIPPSEIGDTTGAGDAFIGAVLYDICADMPPEAMFPFAVQVVSKLICWK
ncbi:hypothetical protein M9H77_31996 [Catharanthus roseus]|uniref:Uncharacterized protein n=1 Tax=Catharanthus roseus TaxID=4058 RepID=A0ACC0A3Q3_CATRO|nr:hypothetical protein M9H77_31996 [Catharanthus roseus]